jgi:UDP-N-acetylmuramoyl-tripeptide--D-alanyl-D-alanine ligase
MVGLQVGLSLEEASQGLADFRVPPARLQIEEGRDGMMLVNDNFNANPDSTRLLLEEISTVAQGRPVILIMGDMENKNARNAQYARDVHREIGRQIGRLDFTHLLAVGHWASEYVEGALAEGVSQQKVAYFSTVEEAKSKAAEWAILFFEKLIIKPTSYI